MPNTRPSPLSSSAISLAIAAGCVLVAASSASAREEADIPSLSAVQWREDLAALARHLRENHRNPFHTLAQGEFDTAYQSLARDIESLPPRSVVLRMAQLVSSIGDGHTRLTLPVDTSHLGFRLNHRADPPPSPGVPRFGVLPIRLQELSGGIYIVAATGEHEDLLGRKLLLVGQYPVEDAIAALEPWIPADTRSARRFGTVVHLAVPELLQEAGIIEHSGTVALTLENSHEDRQSVALHSLPFGAEVEWSDVQPRPPAAAQSGPFGIESRRGQRALVIRLDLVQDTALHGTLGQFGQRLQSALAKENPERVLLDLRRNHGGNSTLSRAIVLPLARWEGSSQYGRLFTLVGPETFSAAVDLLGDLEQWTQNIIVGQGPGSGPTAYSDADRETLPHSGLVLRVSTSYRIGWTGGESRTHFDVDLPVQPTIEGFLAGRDEALERALQHAVGDDLATQMVRAYEHGGINSALFVGFRSRTDPRTTHLSTEKAMNQLGAHLLDLGEDRFAAGVFLFNRENYPRSVDAFYGEARAKRRLGALAEARELVDAAIDLAPGRADLLSLRAALANPE